MPSEQALDDGGKEKLSLMKRNSGKNMDYRGELVRVLACSQV